MVNAEQVIEIYEHMSDLTGQMLSAARARDWETLAKLEARCAGHVRTLQAGAGTLPLAGAPRERKVSLIHKILADDRAIRDLTTPWMAELAALLSSTTAERKLNRAYGAV
jgi:flagellar protein FliT